MSIRFKDIKSEIKEVVKCHSEQEWEIFLPYKTSYEELHLVLGICRKHLLVRWHLYFPEPTEECPKPEIKMTWDPCTE